MLYANAEAFMAEPHKRVTLMGMSNVGKTRLASILPRESWFHYSVDYRLATAHLREDIIDALKVEMMKNPYLARHLRSDAVRVDVNVEFANLSGISHYLGVLGDPAKGGLPEEEFRTRQARHRAAEAAAVRDLAQFIARGRSIYGYPHFLNDASGSLCELIDLSDPFDPVLAAVTDNTVLIYIEADTAHVESLVAAARAHPKPLYYRPEFLDEALASYRVEHQGHGADPVDPEGFAQWVFPRLLTARRPRYDAIAANGYIVSARDVAGVTSEAAFVRLIGAAIDVQAGGRPRADSASPTEVFAT